MNPLKLAFITDKAAPWFVGGYETRVYEIARRLARRNEVRVYTSMAESATVISGVQYHRIMPLTFTSKAGSGRSHVHSLMYALRLAANPLGHWKPDVVIAESIPYLQLPLMGRWVRAMPSVKVLNVNEAWDSYPFRPGLLRVPSRVALKRALASGLEWADLVVGISKVTSESLRTHYGLRTVSTIPMGVDNALARPDTALPLEKRYDFSAMARLVPIKRIADLLVALSLLKKGEGWGGSAVIVGDGPLLGKLSRMTSNLGLDHQVEFTGVLTGKEKYRVISRSRLFVLPSEREGFSIATLEALACGVPAIVAQPAYPEVFGVSDIVVNGTTGFYYPVGDVQALAECMRLALSDRGRLDRMRVDAVLVAEKYDWEEIANLFETEVRRLVEG